MSIKDWKKIFYHISIVMDSEILDQLTDLGRDVDSEFPKPRVHKKKADTRVNELEDNDVTGAAEGVRDWSDHLRKPRPDNYWSDQNFENIRL